MKFSIGDLLWLAVAVALGCLLLLQRQQFISRAAGLREEIATLEKKAREPRSVTVNAEKHYLPPGGRRAIVDFGKDGSISVRFEP